MDYDPPHEWEWRAELGLDELEEPSPPVNRARAVGAERAASPRPVPAIYIEAERGPPKPAAPQTGRPQKRPPPLDSLHQLTATIPRGKGKGETENAAQQRGWCQRYQPYPIPTFGWGKGKGKGWSAKGERAQEWTPRGPVWAGKGKGGGKGTPRKRGGRSEEAMWRRYERSAMWREEREQKGKTSPTAPPPPSPPTPTPPPTTTPNPPPHNGGDPLSTGMVQIFVHVHQR